MATKETKSITPAKALPLMEEAPLMKTGGAGVETTPHVVQAAGVVEGFEPHVVHEGVGY